MCGLYGSIGFAPDPRRIDIVAHRGPDGRGWVELDSAAGPVCLGHRRLAILDLSDAGLQPMSDPSGRYAIVFNGEIYNFVELRAELETRGHRFRTQTDTEVLLAGYAQWGEAALDRLRGMFAFLIWDKEARSLFAARDRFGIKPLYYVAGPSGVAFASEIKQLLGLPGLSGRMNVARVHDFLASGMADHTGETMHDGVRQLRAGECARVRTDDGLPRSPAVSVTRYYTTAVDGLEMSEDEAAARFGELLERSVDLHLRADVAVGSCLSGGLDSSSIVCLMAQRVPADTRVHTVSACYRDERLDEKPYMDLVVGAAGSIPHFVFPRPEDVFASASDITWHQDEPFGSTSIFAQWCVFEEARKAGIKVMLDGQGADEPLAGYHNAFPHHMCELARRGQVRQLMRTLVERRRDHGVAPMRQLGQAVLATAPQRLVAIARALDRRAMPFGSSSDAHLDTPLLRAHGNPDGAFALAGRALDLAPVRDIATLSQTLTFAANLQMLLHWEDRNAMAHSIEARVPFLDHPLVEFALGLGNAHKIVGSDTKRVLRRAMRRILPEPILERRDKLGFATPEEAWFRGPLRGTVHDGVEKTLALYPDLLDGTQARRLRDDMLQGRRRFDFACGGS